MSNGIDDAVVEVELPTTALYALIPEGPRRLRGDDVIRWPNGARPGRAHARPGRRWPRRQDLARVGTRNSRLGEHVTRARPPR